ncbi:MAG: HAD-IA family hydrolase [Candidatus Cloacimonadaceae bacterium]|nr:HAD-IA family hydrolase [Candidatus Cloacimonadaceae bacterium]
MKADMFSLADKQSRKDVFGQKPFLLFDFDGTIADSVHPMYELFNQLAPKYGIKPISQQDFSIIRSMSIPKAFKHLGIPFYKLARAIPVALREYRKIINDLEPCAGIIPMLNKLQAAGIPMALLSSNSIENVHLFLDKHDIQSFDWVEGTGGILKKHTKIKHQIRKHKLDRSRVIYVGDESRDIVAAQKCGIRIISVSWGFHTAEHLCSFDPDFLVNRAEEIVDLVLKNDSLLPKS